jgi:N-acetylneuraminate lyase
MNKFMNSYLIYAFAPGVACLKTASGEERFLVHETIEEDEERTNIYKGTEMDGAIAYGKPGKKPPMWLHGIMKNEMKVAKGKINVIAHIAAPSTRDSIELAKHAESCGVDAIAAIPPIYFRLPEHAIEKYSNDMASSTNLDFIIYNIPQTTGYALSMNLFNKMRENKHVIGVKNSSMPVQDIQMFKAAGGEDFIVFNGPDEQFVGGRCMGADGGIGGTYAVMPELFLKADEYIRAGEIDKAKAVQFDICEIIYDMCACHGNLYAAMKAILKQKGMDIGGARLPLAAVTEEDKPQIEKCILKIHAAIAKHCS